MKPLKLAAKLRGKALRALWSADIDPQASDAQQQLQALINGVVTTTALYAAVTDAVMRQTDESGVASGDDGTVV